MAEAVSTLTRHDLEAKIVKRCWENEDFRREFTANPAGAAVKYLNAPADKLPKIVVHEEPAGSWYIVLPSRPAKMNELSEQDLERVAGGGITDYSLQITLVTAGVSLSGVSAVGSAAASAKFDPGW
jgi:hypothetical protein